MIKKTTALKNLIKCSRREYKDCGPIKPSVCIAMAMHETGFLQSNIMVKNRGYFGIKYSGVGLYYEVLTTEYYNGIKKRVFAKFRKYKTTKEAVSDYYDLFLFPRYKNVKRNQPPAYQIEQIVKAGYATDPKYVDAILHIIDANYLRCLDYYGESIIDCLTNAGIDSTFSKRAEIAKELKIKNYTGTKAQNKKMLKLIRQGKLILS